MATLYISFSHIKTRSISQQRVTLSRNEFRRGCCTKLIVDKALRIKIQSSMAKNLAWLSVPRYAMFRRGSICRTRRGARESIIIINGQTRELARLHARISASWQAQHILQPQLNNKSLFTATHDDYWPRLN